jgi:hypothetical protein
LFLPSLFVSYGIAVEGGTKLLDRTLSEQSEQAIVLLDAPSALPVHHFRPDPRHAHG